MVSAQPTGKTRSDLVARAGAAVMLVGVVMAVVGALMPWFGPTEYTPESRNGIQDALYDMTMMRWFAGPRALGLIAAAGCGFLVVDGALRVLSDRSGGMGMLGAVVGFVVTMIGLTWETGVARPLMLTIGAQLYYVSFVVVLVGALIVREAPASQAAAKDA